MAIIPTNVELREAARLSREVFRIVLASQSPRRRRLLADVGFQFDVVPARDGAEQEENGIALDPSTLAFDFARKKALDVVEQLRTQGATAQDRTILVLACDSVAECQGQTLGKPIDRLDAERMLRMLSGSIHYVRTGVTIIPLEPNGSQRLQTVAFVETSTLVTGYLDSELWAGKAGAFGYQDGNDWLRLLGGSESNVVGLPLESVARVIVRYGRELTNA